MISVIMRRTNRMLPTAIKISNSDPKNMMQANIIKTDAHP